MGELPADEHEALRAKALEEIRAEPAPIPRCLMGCKRDYARACGVPLREYWLCGKLAGHISSCLADPILLALRREVPGGDMVAMGDAAGCPRSDDRQSGPLGPSPEIDRPEASRVGGPQRPSVEIGERVPADLRGSDEIPW